VTLFLIQTASRAPSLPPEALPVVDPVWRPFWSRLSDKVVVNVDRPGAASTVALVVFGQMITTLLLDLVFLMTSAHAACN
jgi:hypothetical protein